MHKGLMHLLILEVWKCMFYPGHYNFLFDLFK